VCFALFPFEFSTADFGLMRIRPPLETWLCLKKRSKPAKMGSLGQSSKTKLHIGSCRIDLERALVLSSDPGMSLTPRAEALLILLCRHANDLVTREQIHDDVWAGRVVEDPAITNCVSQVRKAIGDHDKSVLQTRSKRGYLLVVPDSAWIADKEPTDLAASDSKGYEADSTIASECIDPDRRSVSWTSTTDRSASSAFLKRATIKRIGRFALVFGAVALLLLSAFKFVPGWGRTLPDTVNSEISVSILAPKDLEWLRTSLLRLVVEHTYLRDFDVVLFDDARKTKHFSSPHLQIVIHEVSHKSISAEISIDHAGKRLQKRYLGNANGVASAVEKMIEDGLGMPQARPTPAVDALISGLTAELTGDNQTALSELHRAIARDNDLVDAKIAMARVYAEQGRIKRALRLIDDMNDRDDLSRDDRCRIADLFVLIAQHRAAREKIPPFCIAANTAAKLNDLKFRDVLRDFRQQDAGEMGPTQWRGWIDSAIEAHLRLQEFSQAGALIEGSSRIAADSGWRHADAEMLAARAYLAERSGKKRLSATFFRDAELAMRSLGDKDEALRMRLLSLLAAQIEPGPDVEPRRVELQNIVRDARTISNAWIEIDALDALAQLQRDDPNDWLRSIRRRIALSAEERDQEYLNRDMYIAIDEIRAMHRYRAAIDGVDRLEHILSQSQQSRIWTLTLRAESFFARDELEKAMSAIDAMQKENIEITDTASECQFAWLYAEAGRFEEARHLVSLCHRKTYDRASRPGRGDFGLLAQARLAQRSDDPNSAWPLVAPRIEQLIATPDLSRQEAESLALLSRHAVSMPGADRSRLRSALRLVETIAAKDGAGPTLRTGTHLLRWRLCASLGGLDCGPVLPAWAPEDLLEARLARAGE